MAAERKRASRSEIYRKVLGALRAGEFNINQIKEALDSEISWDAVNNAVNVMIQLGLVQEKNGKFCLAKTGISKNPSTILGLPLAKSQEKRFCEIANRVRALSENIKQTALQKAVVGTIKKLGIKNLPYAWYMYSECCVHRLEEPVLSQYGETKEHDAAIKEALEETSRFRSTDDLLKHIYEKEGRQLYLLRLAISGLLAQPISQGNAELLKNLLSQCIIAASKEELSKKSLYWLEALASSYSMLRRLPLEQLEMLRPEIITAFDSAWQLVALDNFEHIKSFYEIDVTEFFEERRAGTEELLRLQLMRLKDSWPEIKLSPESEQIRKKFTKTQEGKAR